MDVSLFLERTSNTEGMRAKSKAEGIPRLTLAQHVAGGGGVMGPRGVAMFILITSESG